MDKIRTIYVAYQFPGSSLFVLSHVTNNRCGAAISQRPADL